MQYLSDYSMQSVVNLSNQVIRGQALLSINKDNFLLKTSHNPGGSKGFL